MIKKEYDLIITTNIPSYYKTRIWNELAQSRNILVVYSLNHTNEKDSKRSNDFLNTNFKYDYIFLHQSPFWACIELIRLLLIVKYKKIVLGGYDEFKWHLLAWLSQKKKNVVLVETSIYETKTTGWRFLLKKLFFKRISIGLPAGIAQERAIRAFGYKGICIQSGGCGFLNYVKQPDYVESKSGAKKFIWVGRLIKLKRVDLLIEVFNKHPELELVVVGDGEERELLQSKANKNISFLGMINNSELSSIYRKCDAFILPSDRETWGLVVEEALNNGLPVILSDKIGCLDDFITTNDNVGLTFSKGNIFSLENAILQVTDKQLYNQLRLGVSKLNFLERKQRQLKTYQNLIN